MSLRYGDDDVSKCKDQLEYSESSGPLHQGINYRIKDDRKVPIEIIRKPKIIINNYNSNDPQKKNVVEVIVDMALEV